MGPVVTTREARSRAWKDGVSSGVGSGRGSRIFRWSAGQLQMAELQGHAWSWPAMGDEEAEQTAKDLGAKEAKRT